ncbi:MAG: hypothetical protein PHI24_09940 [Desulfitobacteriaceae bacterium]|nr:hypothetical protein [Desulfitobacteriaceae bacterium]
MRELEKDYNIRDRGKNNLNNARNARQDIWSAGRNAMVHSTAIPTTPGVTILGTSTISWLGEEKLIIKESH